MHRGQHRMKSRIGVHVRLTLAVALAAATALALIAPAAVAKQGGIKVDDDDLCGDIHRQFNRLTDTGVIWLNSPTGLEGDYSYSIFNDNEDPIIEMEPIDFDWCGEVAPTYFWAEFDVPEAEGSYTLVVYVEDEFGNIKTVGGDAFLVV
jgi:hypothetical protein